MSIVDLDGNSSQLSRGKPSGFEKLRLTKCHIDRLDGFCYSL